MGKRRTFYGKTRREVAEKLQAAQRSIADGLPIPGGRLTVDQYFAQYLESARSTIRPNTYSGYERSIRLHVIPDLGRRRLAQLGPQDLQTLYQKLLDKGLSPRSVRN